MLPTRGSSPKIGSVCVSSAKRIGAADDRAAGGLEGIGAEDRSRNRSIISGRRSNMTRCPGGMDAAKAVRIGSPRGPSRTSVVESTGVERDEVARHRVARLPDGRRPGFGGDRLGQDAVGDHGIGLRHGQAQGVGRLVGGVAVDREPRFGAGRLPGDEDLLAPMPPAGAVLLALLGSRLLLPASPGWRRRCRPAACRPSAPPARSACRGRRSPS